MSLVKFAGISDAWGETTQSTPASNTPANTQTTTQAASSGTAPPQQGQAGSFLHMLPMLILFILVFYFLLVRPQTKRAKEQKKLLESVTVGDEVMTTGGIIGRVVRLKDNYVVLTIAKGVDITMQKGSVASILPKGTMEPTD